MNEESQPKNHSADEAGAANPGPNSPAEKAGSNWEMPAPIFRVSEGVQVSKKSAEPTPEKQGQIVHAPLPDSPPDIKPEPETVDPPAVEELVLEPVPAKRSTNIVLSFIMTAVGIVGMIVFLIVLLGIIYFYFIYKAEPGSVF